MPDRRANWASALIQARQTVLPKRLVLPGPDARQLDLIVGAAAAAPDHGELVPWRFVVVGKDTRSHLASVFGQALRERDAKASPEQLAQAREKAFRAPTLMLAVASMGSGEQGEIPMAERLVSAGCAIQNMLIMCTALGFGSGLTSGKALTSRSLRALFSLRADEQALCFLSIGTVLSRKPKRARPQIDQYISLLVPPPAAC